MSKLYRHNYSPGFLFFPRAHYTFRSSTLSFFFSNIWEFQQLRDMVTYVSAMIITTTTYVGSCCIIVLPRDTTSQTEMRARTFQHPISNHIHPHCIIICYFNYFPTRVYTSCTGSRDYTAVVMCSSEFYRWSGRIIPNWI